MQNVTMATITNPNQTDLYLQNQVSLSKKILHELQF